MATMTAVAVERSGPAIRAALAQAGDFIGLSACDEHGNWIKL